MLKKTIRIYLSIILLITIFSVNVNGIELKLSLHSLSQNEKIVEKDRFAIEYLLSMSDDEYNEEFVNINAPDKVKGCRIISFSKPSVPRSTTYLISYYITLEAEKAGKYSFGPIKYQNVESNKLSFEIYKSDDKVRERITNLNSGNEDIFIRAELSNAEVYEGMTTELVTKLYYKISGLVGCEELQPLVIKNCEVEESQIISKNISKENINGTAYYSYIISRKYVTPLKSGKVKIKGGKYRLIAEHEIYVEDPFWGLMRQTEPCYYDIEVPEVELKVKKFPAERPSNYLGAIGQFNVSAKISSTHVNVGQVLSLTYSVNGVGNISDLRFPELVTNLKSSEISEPYISQREQTIEGNEVGICRFEYTIKPTREGEFIIEPVEFVFFNAETGEFETAVARGFTITVSEGENYINTENKEVY